MNQIDWSLEPLRGFMLRVGDWLPRVLLAILVVVVGWWWQRACASPW